jgi:hypothetical protein
MGTFATKFSVVLHHHQQMDKPTLEQRLPTVLGWYYRRVESRQPRNLLTVSQFRIAVLPLLGADCQSTSWIF